MTLTKISCTEADVSAQIMVSTQQCFINRSIGCRRNLFVFSFLDENYFLVVLSILLCPDVVLQDIVYSLIELIRTRSN